MLATIKHQMTGDLVRAAQYLMGYAERNEATGEYDADFVAFVCSWQGERGLTADGVIGPKTWTAIAKELPTCSTSKNKKSGYSCAVQILVGGLDVDGSYGPATKQAVAAYQSASGLSADGICGQKTWASLIGVSASTGTETTGGTGAGTGAGQTTSGGKTINNCVHYLQWDKRWKNIRYSTHTDSQTIGNSGCGPSSMAMIMATFIDKNITPVEMCKLAVDNGYRTYDNGTSWGFYEYVYKHYDGFSKYMPTGSVETLKAGLAQGALAVCSVNSNDNHFWTGGGHFITAIGFDDDGYIYANDPNKSSAPRKQHQDKFKTCLKQAFLFWPPVEEKTEPEPEPVKEVPEQTQPVDETREYKLDGAIVDISKHQGTIDFDKLKEAVSLVIARASCGSDKDIRIDEYAKAMNARGIPFGVYCYSYAGTVEKAKDEVQKMISYVSEYKPLFYVMDAEEERLTNDTIRAFADELRKQGIERIGCYVAHHRYKSYGYDSLRELFNFTWIPCYGSNDGTIEGSRKPSYVCDLWQYTSTGKIEGIKGNADVNVITGQGKTLSWFLGGESGEPTPEPTVERLVEVIKGNVNVRTESSTNGSIIGVAKLGTTLVYRGQTASNGWLAVKYNGQDGWISGNYGKLL